MNRKRQAQVEAEAYAILRSAKAFAYPVKIEKVAKHLGVELIDFDFGDDITTALVQKENGNRARIGINTNLTSKPYRRMTIAHALGHYALGHYTRTGMCIDMGKSYWTIFSMQTLDDETASRYIQEREANAFGAALLLPEDLLVDSVKEWTVKTGFRAKDDLMEHLSKAFNVSIQLLGLRMSTLKTLW
ncbi:MAG: ImmA/IrrE family metallo-endopeptidase [Cytophagaceae bacterium]|nr:MAG: ImmA/IrrE family metallo-endopeptidase [Cytophagaceae bacterium]